MDVQCTVNELILSGNFNSTESSNITNVISLVNIFIREFRIHSKYSDLFIYLKCFHEIIKKNRKLLFEISDMKFKLFNNKITLN